MFLLTAPAWDHAGTDIHRAEMRGRGGVSFQLEVTLRADNRWGWAAWLTSRPLHRREGGCSGRATAMDKARLAAHSLHMVAAPVRGAFELSA